MATTARCVCCVSDHGAARAEHKGARVHTPALDAIRGFGALQVSLGHWGVAGETGGGSAVQTFFIMSGFIMMIGYAGKGPVTAPEKCASCPSIVAPFTSVFARSFWIRRIARVGPLVWLSVLLYIPLFFVVQRDTGEELDDGVRLSFILTPLFLQAWFGAGAVNGPLWTVRAVRRKR